VRLAALYNHVAKRRRVPGAIAMGSVRLANASTGVLPLVLAGATSPFALLGPLLIGLYSAGITILSTAEDRPGPATGRLWFARATAFVAYAGAGILACVGARSLSLGLFLAGAACPSIAFGRVPRRGAVRQQVLELLLEPTGSRPCSPRGRPGLRLALRALRARRRHRGHLREPDRDPGPAARARGVTAGDDPTWGRATPRDPATTGLARDNRP
jgi:hypothetical protein